MDQKSHKMGQKGLKYVKKFFFGPNTCVICAILFSGILGTPSPLSASGKIRTLLKSTRKLAVIWKNQDSFEIIYKIGNHLEKCGQFQNHL